MGVEIGRHTSLRAGAIDLFGGQAVELTYRLTREDHQRFVRLAVARVRQHANQVTGWHSKPARHLGSGASRDAASGVPAVRRAHKPSWLLRGRLRLRVGCAVRGSMCAPNPTYDNEELVARLQPFAE